VRIKLTFFLPLFISLMFFFSPPLLVTHTMDDHRHKILVVLILTMPMKQVSVAVFFFFLGLLCFLKLYYLIQVLDLEIKSPFKNFIKTKQALK
jgi:hypothetical protein